MEQITGLVTNLPAKELSKYIHKTKANILLASRPGAVRDICFA
jgi:hypothetical protein